MSSNSTDEMRLKIVENALLRSDQLFCINHLSRT